MEDKSGVNNIGFMMTATSKNYFDKVAEIDVSELPPNLREGYDFVKEITEGHTTWAYYNANGDIKSTVDEYLANLSEFLKSKGTVRQPNPAKPTREKAKSTNQSASFIKSQQTMIRQRAKAVKHVEHIQEEIKYIKRYVGLHNKVKSPNAILIFIKALQRSIVQKFIQKTSPLAKEIRSIQEALIKAYNGMKGKEAAFTINKKDLGRLVSIAGGELVYPSITAIKRFIGLQEKPDIKKINAFLKYLENLAKNKKITRDDPYADKVNSIYKIIKLRKGNKIPISKTELNGLEGILNDCNCGKGLGKIYITRGRKLRRCNQGTYTDADYKGACSHNKGLSGVLTAEEMANRQLDLLEFFSVWLSLFGKPAKNFTMMFHGEPHNGKTIFLLKFAEFLAVNFGNVLYVSSEEFASTTMTTKVNELLNPFPQRLHFAENLKDPVLLNYDFIVLDSVNDLGLKINEYKELRKAYPNTAFIFILQHTKSGDFRGGKDWEHLAEIVGEVEKGVVSITKNRYAPKSSIDFFKHLGIEWKEPQAIAA